ncbi:MBL fold metallo-hydrolase [Glaciecola sp. SC05]|uniref:MBL fold metallo-hydrolase n=1 Tax=Glaciecola sp. SC05 TaxID=1987355 RepID=UPI0035270EB9
MHIHQLRGYIQNIFLIEYPHGCLLLDGACKADFTVIADYFKHTLQRPLSDLKVVLVTHMHPDHAGCAHYLRKKSGCQIISGVFNKQWYAGIGGKVSHLTDIFLAHWVASKLGRKRSFIWYPPNLHPDLMLADGEAVPGFSDWQVLYTPGHTSMDISVVNHEHKCCYVADLVVKVRGQLQSPYPVNHPKDYKASLKRLNDLNGYTIMMAHVPSQQISKDEITELVSRAPNKPQNVQQTIFHLARRLARFKSQSEA